jgi:hypothetical protein
MVVAITDATFHRSGEDSDHVYGDYAARDLAEIALDLDGVIVSTIDPAVLDEAKKIDELEAEVDPDFWPKYSGGVGADNVDIEYYGIGEDISLFDLELLVLGEGLLEIPLAPAISSTCLLSIHLDDTPVEVGVTITHDADAVSYSLSPNVIAL